MSSVASTSCSKLVESAIWIFCTLQGFFVLARNENLKRNPEESEEEEDNGERIETNAQKKYRNPTKSMPVQMDPKNGGGNKQRRSLRPRLSGVEQKKVPIQITVDGKIPFTHPSYDPSKAGSVLDQLFEDKVEIGRGHFGTVHRVKSRQTSEPFAVKVALKKGGPTHEAEVFTRVPAHKNVISFSGAWVDNDELHIQTELCKCDLTAFSESKSLDESEIWKIVLDLVSGLNHLHGNGWIHNDIKPDNIFLDEENTCKFGDFGLMCGADENKTVEGDARFLAPEVLNGVSTRASDVYSLGVTYLVIATDLHIPGGQGKTARAIRNGRLPGVLFANVSMELKGIIMQMIDKDPERRPTCAELMEHPEIKVRIESKNNVFAGATSSTSSGIDDNKEKNGSPVPEPPEKCRRLEGIQGNRHADGPPITGTPRGRRSKRSSIPMRQSDRMANGITINMQNGIQRTIRRRDDEEPSTSPPSGIPMQRLDDSPTPPLSPRRPYRPPTGTEDTKTPPDSPDGRKFKKKKDPKDPKDDGFTILVTDAPPDDGTPPPTGGGETQEAPATPRRSDFSRSLYSTPVTKKPDDDDDDEKKPPNTV